MELGSIIETFIDGHFKVVIINAITRRDLEVVSLALLKAEKSGHQFLFRTAASIIPVLTGQAPLDELDCGDLLLKEDIGGLIIVGSYVPRTTHQLNDLLQNNHLESFELSVRDILDQVKDQSLALPVSTAIEQHLKTGKDVVLYTSREPVMGKDEHESLQIINQVASTINRVVQAISIKPRFVIAKGGITSSDIATKCFDVTRALVLGQILPGVPVWQLDGKWPGLTYVVFPGNVGTDTSLSEAYKKLIL
jgi:uncharacterized protein YgbK (DUF1537 family)